jgi:hypothetical protein
MKRIIEYLLIIGALCLLPAWTTPAQEQTQSVETQLRERLRDTILQLRAAETDRAALQAAQAQSADEAKALKERIAALTKQADANKQAAQTATQNVETLKSRVSRQDSEIARLNEATENCRQAAALDHNKAVERIQLADQAVIKLEKLVADREDKNLALYKLANEILQRYEKFGLGDVLMAREPFVGISRVKLQNLVQDYQDKLLNERATLHEKDLPEYGNKLLEQPSEAVEPVSVPPKQTSE